MSEGNPASLPDYSAFAPAAVPAQGSLAAITELAREEQRLFAELTAAEAEVRRLKDEHKRVAEELLPEAMDAAQQEKIRTADGATVEVKKIISTSCAEGRVVRLVPWLEANGHGDVVKRIVQVKFGRNEEKQAEAATLAAVAVHGKGRVGLAVKVESQTLNKLIRDRMERGEDLPPADVVIVTELRVCRVTPAEDKD